MRFVLLFFVAWTGLSCSNRRVYNEYQHVPVEGWEKTDARLFSVAPIEEGGQYDVVIGLRTSMEYPFMSLVLVVETDVINTDTSYSTVPTMRTDTLLCSLTDARGRSKGTGVSIRQFEFPMRSVRLAAGDSLRVCVRHCMKRDMLPGVCDLGVCLIRREN